MVSYGPRDAVCVLMGRGHKVARRWSSSSSRFWVVDGKRVTLAELEDLAELYERLRYRHTARPAQRPKETDAMWRARRMRGEC